MRNTYYICFECESKYSESVPWDDLTPQQSEENLLDFLFSAQSMTMLLQQQRDNKINKIESTMRKTLQDSDISTIMENSPHPYPSPVKINSLLSKKLTICGRRL